MIFCRVNHFRILNSLLYKLHSFISTPMFLFQDVLNRLCSSCGQDLCSQALQGVLCEIPAAHLSEIVQLQLAWLLSCLEFSVPVSRCPGLNRQFVPAVTWFIFSTFNQCFWNVFQQSESFLQKPEKRVFKISSELKRTKFGVLQNLILGPLLYLCYFIRYH